MSDITAIHVHSVTGNHFNIPNNTLCTFFYGQKKKGCQPLLCSMQASLGPVGSPQYMHDGTQILLGTLSFQIGGKAHEIHISHKRCQRNESLSCSIG